MSKIHVKKDDMVYVLTGKDAGKEGKVLAVIPKTGRVIVEGVNMVTKHKRPNQRMQTGGLVHQEAPIHASNVMVICPKTKRPSKVGYRFTENGEKVRYCKVSGEVLDSVKVKK